LKATLAAEIFGTFYETRKIQKRLALLLNAATFKVIANDFTLGDTRQPRLFLQPILQVFW